MLRCSRWILLLFSTLSVAACATVDSTATPGPAFYTALAPALSTPTVRPTRSLETFTTTPTASHAALKEVPSTTSSATGAEPDVTSTHPTTRIAPTTSTPFLPTPVVPPDSQGPAAPLLYETTITLLTYDKSAALIETSPDDPVYPYPRLDFGKIGPPAPQAYRAIVLENGYVSVTILPELGGRIYRWVDKASGRHLLYENKVVKPTQWGYRGWWLSVGGIEWAFPVEEHGLNEWRPWEATTGYTAHGLAVTVSDQDDRTGMEVGATISLDADHAYITIQPWARNDTNAAQEYQFWLNGMLTLGADLVSEQTQFIIPAEAVIVHSTGDTTLPAPGEWMSWPIHAGRDFSWYGNWAAHLGFFVPNLSHGFVGVYDHSADQGIVRAFTPGWPPGTKLFGPAGLSSRYWTDDETDYVELWSGATASFAGNATLGPGESVQWTERWYPVRGMSGFTYANESAALRLVDTGGGAQVGVAVSARTNGQLSLWAGSQLVANWPINLLPGQALNAEWSRPSNVIGPLGLKLEDNQGVVLARTGNVP